MPLFYKYTEGDRAELSLWELEEPEVWFLERLQLSHAEELQFSEIKGHRRVEWLSVRYLMSQMLGAQAGPILKDEFGKPYLVHLPLHISISHSHKKAAAMVAKDLAGIDIQKLVEKIERIAHRMMRKEELESLEAKSRLEHLHVYWGAKECLYKAYGRRALDFCSHIFIEPFSFDPTVGKAKGRVLKDSFDVFFDIYYRQIEDYMLVYALKTAD